MKINATYRKDLTTEEKMDILVDTAIDVLHKVVKRYGGIDKVADIRAALTNLTANRLGADALTQAMFYCTDNWTIGPVN